MSLYPKEILGNKALEEMYSLTVKAQKKIERLQLEKAQLEDRLETLKLAHEATVADIEKAKRDIEDLKPKTPHG